MQDVQISQQDGFQVVRIGQWPFEVRPDEPPRIRDIDLAERLEYAEPRAIRKLIGRLVKQGLLPGIHVRDTMSRTSMPQGGERETTVDEYWLTQAEALIVGGRSETQKAGQLLQDMAQAVQFLLTQVLPSLQRYGVYPAPEDSSGLIPPETRALVKEVAAGIVGPIVAPILEAIRDVGSGVQHLGMQVAEVRSDQESQREALEALRRRVDTHLTHKRKSFKAEDRQAMKDAALARGGLCPCCEKVRLFDERGNFTGEVDHYHAASDAYTKSGWPVCKKCNARANSGDRPNCKFDSWQLFFSSFCGPLFRVR